MNAESQPSADEWAAGLAFAPMTLPEAREIADVWRYPEPYSFYDADADPEDYAELIDPEQWPEVFLAAHDSDGGLVGFVTGERLDDAEVDGADAVPDDDAAASEGAGSEIALGLRPDLTGGGRGLPFLRAGLERLSAAGLPGPVVLEVAAFNRRAVTVYERAGFRVLAEHDQETNGGVFPFLRMQRDA